MIQSEPSQFTFRSPCVFTTLCRQSEEAARATSAPKKADAGAKEAAKAAAKQQEVVGCLYVCRCIEGEGEGEG